MRDFQVLISLLIGFVKSQPETTEICGRSRHLVNLLENDTIVTVSEGGQGRSSEALPNLWPWTGQLIYSETKIHRCSATVVSDDMVITAARCFSRSRNPSRYAVIIGGHRNGSGRSYAVRNISIHPLFDVLMPSSFDVAVARLNEKINFSKNILPICLPMFEPSSTENCIVTGWDSQEEDGNFPMKLREIQVPIIPIFICNSVLYYFGRLDPLSMICAGSDRADTCQDDSGGPLMCYNGVSQRWEIQGVASWGHGCGRGSIPGVYAKISAVTGWVNLQITLLKLNDHDIL